MFRIVARFKNLRNLLRAIWAVIENGYPARKLTVIGVTGTDGKTTTAHLIYRLLQGAGKRSALVSTIGAQIGGQSLETGLHTTTPDPALLQSLMSKLVKKKIKYLVLETTSHGLDQHRVLGANFRVGVLTNITPEHLDYHQTFERYRQTKAKLFRGVGIAVLNRDDPSFSFIRARTNSSAKIITYSIKGKASLWADQIKLARQGMNFRLHHGAKTFPSKTSLMGKYNVANILAAAAVAQTLGVAWPKIIAAVANFPQVPGRLEPVKTRRGFSVLIDFAHTPAALENVLGTVRQIMPKNGRLIAVFGCAGERDRGKRSLMGKIAAKLADFSIFTAEDPRSEDVNQIIEEMVGGALAAGGRENHSFFRVPDRGEAIAYALQKLAKKDDVVVLCGKGHEKSMAYDHQDYPWSDREAAKAALRGKVRHLKFAQKVYN